MKKIVFGITNLQMGGAERVLVDIVNKIKDEYDITIFTLYKGGAFEKEVQKKVKIVNMYEFPFEQQSKIKRKIIPLYVLICGKHIYKKYIKGNYDVEIAFLEGAITRIFSTKSKYKKIAWIHNDMSKVFGQNFIAKIKRWLDKRIYEKYDKLVFVSKDNKECFNKFYRVKEETKEKETIIRNYINKERVIQLSNIEENELEQDATTIVTISRLVKQKALDRFIRVHKKLIENHIQNKVYVIGEGPERENLEKLIKENQVENSFILMGGKENPYAILKKADYFALLSEYEGYGMVIDEAKILDKKIIITNTAAKEAVDGYSKKIIVENNEDAIYNGLKQILQKNILFEEKKEEFDNTNLIEDVKKILDF